MTRTSLLGFVGLLAGILAGCPIYSGNGNSGTQSSTSTPGCSSSSQCLANETCGQDGQCHSGDCTLWGCVAGFSCQVNNNTGTASCQPNGSTTTGTGGGPTTSSSGTGGTGTGGSPASTSSGTGGMAPVYCGNPKDCALGETCGTDGTCHAGDCNSTMCIFGYTCGTDGICKSNTANSCDKDTDCAAGSLCIAGPKGGGVCTVASDQCFDQSQCDPGDKCVSGKCIKACAADTDCRDGYLCDTTHGICTTPGMTCTITNDCGGPDKVCVGGTCVPRSTNGMCPSGDVWDENGCIPNQAASFVCVVDGMQDACMTGSICLHHSCWISCDLTSNSPCSGLSSGLNTCKAVNYNATMYDVCGSTSSLGNECGAGANNQTCSGGKICIDGFCK